MVFRRYEFSSVVVMQSVYHNHQIKIRQLDLFIFIYKLFELDEAILISLTAYVVIGYWLHSIQVHLYVVHQNLKKKSMIIINILIKFNNKIHL
jgi:hypothetical protein